MMKTGMTSYVLCAGFWSLLVLSVVTGCGEKGFEGDVEGDSSVRFISFAGYDWEVRSSDEKKTGPGPNLFSDSRENVWVDAMGRLHLRITNRSGKWYCAGITLAGSPQYGRYFFQTETLFEQLHPNTVAGLFLYRSDEKEIDIELSKWGEADNQVAQYVVQPAGNSGNKKRFDLPDEHKTLTHLINWRRDSVVFSTYKGVLADTENAEDLIQKWVYTGPDIPANVDDLATKINFWLFRGIPPDNKNDQEMILSGFRYEP